MDHMPHVSADLTLITAPITPPWRVLFPSSRQRNLSPRGGKVTFLTFNFQVSGLGWPGSALGFFHWDTWLSAWQTGQSKMQPKMQYDALTIPGDSSLASRRVLGNQPSGIFQFRHTSLLRGERAMGLWVGGFFCLGIQEKPV